MTDEPGVETGEAEPSTGPLYVIELDKELYKGQPSYSLRERMVHGFVMGEESAQIVIRALADGENLAERRAKLYMCIECPQSMIEDMILEGERIAIEQSIRDAEELVERSQAHLRQIAERKKEREAIFAAKQLESKP